MYVVIHIVHVYNIYIYIYMFYDGARPRGATPGPPGPAPRRGATPMI